MGSRVMWPKQPGEAVGGKLSNKTMTGGVVSVLNLNHEVASSPLGILFLLIKRGSISVVSMMPCQ